MGLGSVRLIAAQRKILAVEKKENDECLTLFNSHVISFHIKRAVTSFRSGNHQECFKNTNLARSERVNSVLTKVDSKCDKI